MKRSGENKNTSQLFLTYGTIKAADFIEKLGAERYASSLRRWNYDRQVERLRSCADQEVDVLSSGLYTPFFSADSHGLYLDPGEFHPKGAYARYKGKLLEIKPCLLIYIQPTDTAGESADPKGLPFIGASSIREVRNSSGSLLYFNPDVDEGFPGKYCEMSTGELWDQLRRTFGRSNGEIIIERERAFHKTKT